VTAISLLLVLVGIPFAFLEWPGPIGAVVFFSMAWNLQSW
jgi:hypothetical protein